MQFADKEYLFLLLLIVPYILWYVLKHHSLYASLRMPGRQSFIQMKPTLRTYFVHAPFLLRILAFVLLVLILARPQYSNSWQDRETEGIDIMLAIDVSTSMLAEDLHPNRVEAAKKVAAEFIGGRPNDNIGLTLFEGEAFTQCPLTLDHPVLMSFLSQIRCGILENGTAVGMGIVNAVSKLKDSKAKSKVVILLTDGTNNMGDISPLTAADIAKSLGIRIYTIGVGAASYYEDDLRQIASSPSDQYFSLVDDYSSIQTVREKLQNSTCPLVTQILPDCRCNEDMPDEIMMVGHGFPQSSSISLMCQFGEFPATKAKVLNQTHLLCDGPKLVDREEWAWMHTANFMWNGESKVPISLFYNGASIVQNDVEFTYLSCPDYSYLIWVFLGVILVAVILAVLAYIASHTKPVKKVMPVKQASKPAAPPKPEHAGQIDLSMRGV